MIDPRLAWIRRAAGPGLAAALALSLLAAPATVPAVRAAEPDLTIVTAARYDVQPEQHRVRVNLTMVLTNTLRDTVTKRYYFDRAFLSVLPDTSGFTAHLGGRRHPDRARLEADGRLHAAPPGPWRATVQRRVGHLQPALRSRRSRG